MFGFNANDIITRNGVVGMIVRWDGHFAKIMFEVGTHDVEFANYTLSDVARFRVIG